MHECPICLEDISEEKFVLLECCNMKFCSDCLVAWFNKNSDTGQTCPICHNLLNNYYIPIENEVIVDNTEIIVQNYNMCTIILYI